MHHLMQGEVKDAGLATQGRNHSTTDVSEGKKKKITLTP